MAQYGGGSQYGGTSQYGGGDSLWLPIYRALKALAPPGFWPQSDEKLMNKIMRAESMLLAYGWSLTRSLFNEIFPHTTTRFISDWARYLGVVLTSNPIATWEELRAPLIAKWRGSLPPTLPNLRKMFYPLLLPTRARWDDFGDDFVSVRFEKGGLASIDITESGGLMTIAVTAPQIALWDGTTFLPVAPRLFERLPDTEDDFVFETVIDSWSLPATTAAGIYVEQDAKNATLFVFGNQGAGVQTRIDQILEGVLTEDFGSFAIPAIGATILKLAREGDELAFYAKPYIGAGVEIEVGRVDLRHKSRRIGFFTRAGFGVAASSSWIYYSLTMGKPENNVDIIEVPKVAADAAGSPEYVFQTWIRQLESESSGNPQYREAERLADRVKHGHCLIGIIETEQFLTDDPDSLTDRDVLGS